MWADRWALEGDIGVDQGTLRVLKWLNLIVKINALKVLNFVNKGPNFSRPFVWLYNRPNVTNNCEMHMFWCNLWSHCSLTSENKIYKKNCYLVMEKYQRAVFFKVAAEFSLIQAIWMWVLRWSTRFKYLVNKCLKSILTFHYFFNTFAGLIEKLALNVVKVVFKRSWRTLEVPCGFPLLSHFYKNTLVPFLQSDTPAPSCSCSRNCSQPLEQTVIIYSPLVLIESRVLVF